MLGTRSHLRELQELDTALRGGRSLAYVYDSGRADVQVAAAEAVAAYAGSNGLDPSAFPSLLRMENELVGFGCDLLDAPRSVVGTVTSGGTESIMLAVQAARDARPDVARPRMVLPETAHPSFLKAARYFGVEPVFTPVDRQFRAEVGAMAAAMDAHTVLAVASAPSYAHGVIDPVAWIAAAASAKRVPLHVDACIGGWILAYADQLGLVRPAWTFAVAGVSSISMDLHKYGYTPKGASLLLFRDAAGRRPSYFTTAQWPGYTMVNTTMSSTRPGGPVAGAWATVQALGDDGYRQLARECLDAVDRLARGIAEVPGLELVVAPDATLLALRTDGSCDVFTLADEMGERGWYVQPQMAWHGHPPTLHLTVSAATLPHVDDCLAALRSSVAAARAAGPARVDQGILALLDRLDPDTMSDRDFDGLLVAAGLAGPGPDSGAVEAVPLPQRMASISVLLDAAPPRLREVLTARYVERLYHPVRR
ncbi:pyridoxal phosphate-dependent decarboxylase family protein [Nocardioides ferulae]|uniref:pyridoxal phosphate-dependent decarboxylase family protein n=1 Tax=Nocardioides ferulae TaxID=2340821 RepID=UPI000EAF56CC|nr:aspartate aminotransferase family protein [Nocardioides ferulae]